MKNLKKQHWAFCIIFCVFLISVFSCAPEAGVEKKVEALLKADDYNSALELLNEGIKQYPEKPSLRALKVKVLAKLGKFIEAHEEYFRFYNFTKKNNPKLLYELAFGALMAYEDDLWSKLVVASTLEEVGDKGGIDMFKELLKYENVELIGAEILARFGDESGIDVLKEGLNSKFEHNRIKAAVALAVLGDKSGVDILKEGLNNPDVSQKIKAAEALANLDDKSGIDCLKKHLEWGFVASAEALARLSDKSGIDFLKKKVEDGDLDATLALAKLGDKSSITFLKKALEDEREEWIEAAKALARVGDKSIIPILTKLLKERGIELYNSGYRGLIYCSSLILSLYKLTK